MMANQDEDEASADKPTNQKNIGRWSESRTRRDGSSAVSNSGHRHHDESDFRTSCAPSADANDLIPDGGETTEDYAIETSAEGVQQYEDGPLVTVFHDGDVHLIVRQLSCGAYEMKRVPATREAVVENEKLWTIPSNWNPIVRIQDSPHDKVVYHIPESRVDVVLVMLHEEQVFDERFRVKRVGNFRVRIDPPGFVPFADAAEALEDEEDPPEELIDALKTLADNWWTFQHRYQSYMHKWGRKAAGGIFYGGTMVTIDSWTINPWSEEQDIKHLIWKAAFIEDPLRERVANFLIEEDLVSLCPDLQLSVDDREALPVGYDVQSLIEAGVTPDEAVDHVMCVIRDKSLESWAQTRDVSEETIQENLTAVETLIDN